MAHEMATQGAARRDAACEDAMDASDEAAEPERHADAGVPGRASIDPSGATGPQAATFEVDRDELLGTHPLLGSAEVARAVCRGAERVISVLSITAERMRRVDGWLGATGFVTHAAGPDTTVPLLGSVCDRDLAGGLIVSIVESLVGRLPDEPGPDAMSVDAVGALAPGELPTGLDWVVLVTTRDASGSVAVTVVGHAGGLVMGAAGAIDRPVVLAPVSSSSVRVELTGLVGTPPRSVRDLLGDD